jgi:hypothetical protein
MYWLLDLFDQVPYREPGENVVQPARVRTGIEALDTIISEINDVHMIAGWTALKQINCRKSVVDEMLPEQGCL